MRKIAVAFSKGGSGKSTTAVHLAHGLALQGRRVLLVEVDVQAQLSMALGVTPTAGLAELVLSETSHQQAVTPARQHLDLLAGGPRLAAVQREIARREFAGERALSEALAPLEGYDYVILDTAPGWGTLTINALFYASELLAPVNLEVLAVRALGDFAQRVEAVRRYNGMLAWRYVVPTFYDGRVAKSAEVLAILQSHYAARVTEPVRYNVRLSEAPGFGQTVYEYAPTSRGAADYEALTRRVIADE